MAQQTQLGLSATSRRKYDLTLFATKVADTSLEGAEGMTSDEWFAWRRRLRRRGRIGIGFK